MRVVKWIDLHFEEMFLVILLIFLTGLVTMSVLLRYCFNMGITWSDALCRYCLVYSTFLSIAHWVRRSNGIAVDALLQVLPGQVNKLLKLIVRVLMIAFFAYLLKSSVSVLVAVGSSGTTDGSLGFPMTYVYFACTIGFFDAFVRSVQVLVLDILALNRKEV